MRSAPWLPRPGRSCPPAPQPPAAAAGRPPSVYSPARRLCPIAPRWTRCMQVVDEPPGLPVFIPSHPVDSRGRRLLELIVAVLEHLRSDVVEERGKPSPLSLCLAACPIRPSACDTLTRLASGACCADPRSLGPALRSTRSASSEAAMFAGFLATMAGSDLAPRIIGFGSSPSRYGPGRLRPPGQTRDLPGSDAFPSGVIWPPTPAERRHLASRAAHVAFDETNARPLHSRISWLNSYTPYNRRVRFTPAVTYYHATLATRRTLLLTWAGLSPAGPRQLFLAHRHKR